MAETLSMISKISFAATGICLVVAVLFFIRFKIPSVIGDLSGRNARRSIEQMRKVNEKSGNKSYRPSKTNADRGKLTETMHGTRKTASVDNCQEAEDPGTGVLEENLVPDDPSESTALLVDEDATAPLQDEETVELGYNEKPAERAGGIRIEMIDEVMLIHTEEVIT